MKDTEGPAKGTEHTRATPGPHKPDTKGIHNMTDNNTPDTKPAKSAKPAKPKKERKPRVAKPKTLADQAIAALRKHDKFDAAVRKIEAKRATFVQDTPQAVCDKVSLLRAALAD